MQKYKVLLFDADGTLFNFNKAASTALRSVFEANGLSFTDGILNNYLKINNSLWEAHERGEIDKPKLTLRRFELLAEAYDIRDMDCVKINREYVLKLGEGAYLLESAYEVCETLSKNYRMAIITNGLKETQRRRFARSELTHFFDNIIISDEIGVQKPRREFFDMALKLIGAGRDECLVIGDSLTSDIAGANNASIDACWYNPSHSQRTEGAIIKYEIDRLVQLYEIL